MVEELAKTAEEFIEKQKKVRKNSGKVLPKLLKFFNKIDKPEDFDAYLKDIIFIPFMEWFLQVILIRPFLLYICLTAFGNFFYPPPLVKIAIAVGISFAWYLLVSLKQDLWRKE